MKKIISTILLLTAISCCFAQWVSPGNGTTYTMSSLSSAAPNAVSMTQNGVFQVNQDITISAGDALVLDTNVSTINVADNIRITIKGSMTITDRTDNLLMSGDTTGSNLFELFFDEATVTTISHLHFTNGKQILLSECDMVFNNCEFSNCSNSGINYMNCNPIIENCYFHHNQKAAITSAVNMAGSPIIRNNYIYNNDLSNSNIPQINIGPGSTDTIFIVNNSIIGVAQTMSGGIAIMNMGSSLTNIMIKGNLIQKNRYGYTQNGTSISSYIYDNYFLDNDLETNPNNGGSGISIYGTATSCASKIRRNVISGNLWGITAIYYHNIDLGTVEDPGGNIFYNNSNSGIEYALYNNAFSNMTAIGNYWGSNDSTYAEEVIYHGGDAALTGYGVVTYNPIMTLDPEMLSFVFQAENNPTLNTDYAGTLTAESDTLFFTFDVNTCPDVDLTELVPTIGMPLGVTCMPASLEAQDFSQPVTYTLSTPHNSTREYVVCAYTNVNVPERAMLPVSIYPNPSTSGRFIVSNETEGSILVEAYSISGQLVYREQSQDQQLTVNTSSWNNGIYMVRVQQNNKVKVFKMIVQ